MRVHRMIAKATRPPKNKRMLQLYRALVAGEWVPTQRGSPDYYAFRQDKDGSVYFMVVEAVKRKTSRLRKHQAAVLEMLARYGVPCFRYDCDTGEFHRLNFDKPEGVVPPGWRGK